MIRVVCIGVMGVSGAVHVGMRAAPDHTSYYSQNWNHGTETSSNWPANHSISVSSQQGWDPSWPANHYVERSQHWSHGAENGTGTFLIPAQVDVSGN